MRLLDSKLYKADLEKAVKKADLEKLDGKSIFITGGLGLICSAVIDVLLTYGNVKKIYVGARDETQFFERFGEIDKLSFVKYDALEKLQIDFIPDYIIHGAGLASPELYTSMPVETILSNLNGIHFLLEFAKKNSTKKILYISSSEVYGNKETIESFVEGKYGIINIDNIRSSYSIAKRASEMLCKSYSQEYGVNTTIVRQGHIFGPSARKTDKRISSDFAFKAAKGIKLEMKSSGLQKRSYCYSIDCSIQILYALINGVNGDVYNIGHDKITTVREMAEIYAKAGGVSISSVSPTESELNDFNPMNNSSLDNTKIKKLGYSDTFTVEEGLTHTVKIIKEINCF